MRNGLIKYSVLVFVSTEMQVLILPIKKNQKNTWYQCKPTQLKTQKSTNLSGYWHASCDLSLKPFRCECCVGKWRSVVDAVQIIAVDSCGRRQMQRKWIFVGGGDFMRTDGFMLLNVMTLKNKKNLKREQKMVGGDGSKNRHPAATRCFQEAELLMVAAG